MSNITERQAVTIGLFALTAVLLAMAGIRPVLWDNDRFNAILQAVVLTGLLNLIGAFHFSGNQSAAQSTMNTGAAFRAIEATANAAKGEVPQEVVVVNEPTEPVPTKPAKP